MLNSSIITQIINYYSYLNKIKNFSNFLYYYIKIKIGHKLAYFNFKTFRIHHFNKIIQLGGG